MYFTVLSYLLSLLLWVLFATGACAHQGARTPQFGSAAGSCFAMVTGIFLLLLLTPVIESWLPRIRFLTSWEVLRCSPEPWQPLKGAGKPIAVSEQCQLQVRDVVRRTAEKARANTGFWIGAVQFGSQHQQPWHENPKTIVDTR